MWRTVGGERSSLRPRLLICGQGEFISSCLCSRCTAYRTNCLWRGERTGEVMAKSFHTPSTHPGDHLCQLLCKLRLRLCPSARGSLGDRRVLRSSTEGLGVQDGQRSWDNSDKESRMLKGRRPGFLTRPWHSCPGVASQIEDLQPSPCPGVCCGGDVDKGHGNGQISSSRRVCPHTRSSPQRTSAVCIFFWRAGSMRKVVSTPVSRAGGLSDVEQCFSHGHDHRGYLEIVLTYRL